MQEQVSAQDAAPDTSAATVPTTRQRLVRQAIEDWKRQLIDLGGRNNLLYFRDLKVGTLDLRWVKSDGRLYTDEQLLSVYSPNCTAARAAGAAPLYRGQPGYRAALDGDNDGVACE